MLNSEQVKCLFEQEAILIGNSDGVPIYRVAELFGDESAEFAGKYGTAGVYNSIFGVRGFSLHYLTFRGFQQAASYANVLEIKKSKGAPPSAEVALSQQTGERDRKNAQVARVPPSPKSR
ncbi:MULTISPECIES: hypothetical protein [Eubacteriales]|uniref:Uncharacterized protein n=1 Tax=Bittarella massiliensis (ex Durand et al. 2017) TaxID=1720313 RepID=A0AAQ1RW33_9FIRM|nr:MULTISPECIES: hypothetical protein [Eubacteriales]SHG16710.1 hypothetical protein SAMN05444424_1719 [Bittarella massiliensis (ex Durand et al. 2017)]SHG17038.1 hypothetical protein SAMN05444424_1731 [Bittarella massiliensis (ex Durand et al. 2017)]